MVSTKTIFYGGFANVSNQSFNIYEYEVEDFINYIDMLHKLFFLYLFL